jgi:hypothetical protein
MPDPLIIDLASFRPGGSAASYVGGGASGQQTVAGAKFDGTAAQFMEYGPFKLPSDFAGFGTPKLPWIADTATTGAVRWNLSVGAVTPNVDTGDIRTKTYAAVNGVTDTVLGATAGRLHETDAVTLSNSDSSAAGDEVMIRLERDPTHVDDTMSGFAIAVGELEIPLT